MAQRKGQDFDGKEYQTKLGVNDEAAKTELHELQARLDELKSMDPKVNVGMNQEEVNREIEEIQARIDSIHGKDVKVNVDTRESRDGVDRLRDSTDRAIGREGSGGGNGGHGALGLKAALFGLAGVGVAGLLNPLLGTVLGLGGAFGIAGVGLGAFAGIAKSDFKTMSTDVKAVTKAQQELTTATTDQARIKALNDLAAANAKLVGPERQAALAMVGLQGPGPSSRSRPPARRSQTSPVV